MFNKRLSLFVFLSAVGIGCFTVIDTFYFTESGLSLAQVGLLLAVYNVAVAASELPFAFLFDRWSNKRAIQIGNALRFSAFVLFFLNLSMASLYLAMALAGVGAAALSGTSTALVINSTPVEKTVAVARVSLLNSLGALVGGVIGVGLYRVAPRDIWLGAAMMYVVAGIVLAGYQEPSSSEPSASLRSYVKSVKGLVGESATWLAIAGTTAMIIPYLLWQPHLGTNGAFYILAGFFLMKAAGVIGPFVVTKAHLGPGSITAIAIANAAAVVIFGGTSAYPVVAASFFVHVLLQIILVILLMGQFHEGVEPSFRASAGSVVSLVVTGLSAGLAVVAGLLADRYGYLVAASLSAVIYLLVAFGQPASRRYAARNPIQNTLGAS